MQEEEKGEVIKAAKTSKSLPLPSSFTTQSETLNSQPQKARRGRPPGLHYRQEDFPIPCELKKVFKVYYMLLMKPCNAHLWERLVYRLSFEDIKKLVKFLESRECVHSYKNGKERVLTSEREANKNSLISSLCYRI